MKVGRALGTGRAMLAMGVGAVLIAVGSGVGLSSMAPVATAGAATANAQSPIPVVEQNLDSAGRIRVAVPTNPAGQVQVSNGGPMATDFQGPWRVVQPGQSIGIAGFNGPGEFVGMTVNSYGWANGCNCGSPDGSITVTIDGQTVFNAAQSWLGANWLTGDGNVMGGQWYPGWCGNGPCASSFWWPPGGISFQNNVTVSWYNYTGNSEYVWIDTYANSITPVTSSPN